MLQKNVGMLQKSVAELGQLHSQQVHQVELLRQAFNTNHAAYVSAISQADGHMSVMRVVITDMNRHAMGGIEDPAEDLQLLPDGTINWEYYYDQYNEWLKEQDALRGAQAKEAGTLVKAEDFDEIVFGGDVPPQQESRDDSTSTRGGGEIPQSSENSSSTEAAG